MAEPQKFNFSFSFIEPAGHLLEAARKFADSLDEMRRAVAKAVLDVSAAGRTIKDALLQDRDADLAPTSTSGSRTPSPAPRSYWIRMTRRPATWPSA